LPHLKTTYAKYRGDPDVAFLLVSIDDDARRLRRYLDEMQFPFPVVRAEKDEMERAMGFDDLPSTFYVDRDGIVRYQILGFEPHGDSDSRIGWYVDQVRQLKSH
jgi:peroxiredoxin